jgi:hypothetical protein
LGQIIQAAEGIVKAAWAIEHMPQDPGLSYRAMGRSGLESIEDVGPMLAGVIESMLRLEVPRATGGGWSGYAGSVGVDQDRLGVWVRTRLLNIANHWSGGVGEEGNWSKQDG